MPYHAYHSTGLSYNSLQLPRIAQGILDSQLTQLLLVALLIDATLEILIGEEDAAVAD